MHRRIIKLYSIILYLLATASNLCAQEKVPLLPTTSGEHLHFFCDRDFYSVSEDIFFSAFYSFDKNTGLSHWSKVLYVELIKWNGDKISTIKVPIKEGMAQGYMTIPADTRSGNYYLRSYTKWMRNYSPYKYRYIPVKIINPSTREIDNGLDKDTLDPSFVSIVDRPYTGAVIPKGIKKSYACREEVTFGLAVNDPLFKGKYNVSVAKKQQTGRSAINFSLDETEIQEVVLFLPELRTMTLEGSVIHADQKTAVPGEAVVLCSTIDPFYLSITTTDEAGKFIFPIPDTWAQHQYCLQALFETGKNHAFFIHNDFCNKEIRLPYVPFELSSDEEIMARKIVQNAQLYGKFTEKQWKPELTGPARFYGHAKNKVVVEEFIELQHLEEFFFELVPGVGVIKKNNETMLVMESTSRSSLSPLLILMDNVPVANDEKLLSLPSKFIDYIEYMEGRYVINNFMFSGLICIYSKKGDLGGMDLKGGRYYFDFPAFGGLDFDRRIRTVPSESRAADMRNLLYYHPEIYIKGEAPEQIRFHTGDARGVYTITIQGVSDGGGDVVFDQFDFIVK